MVDSWGSGAIMGTTAPEIGHALLQTVAVLTSDADQSVSKETIVSTTSAQIARTRHIMPPKKDPTTRSNEYAYGGAAGEFAGGVAGFAAGACVGDPIDGGAYGAQMGAAAGVIASEAHHGGCSSSNKKPSFKKR